MILCHNHPSGDLTPSGENKTITLRLKEAGKLMGIEVLDHVIISGIEKDRYYSFKESGVLEETVWTIVQRRITNYLWKTMQSSR